MKILLIGNYRYLESQSMDRFASMLFNGLTSQGFDVRLLKPLSLIGRLRPPLTGLGKWLGYVDRFILFPIVLTKAARWADVVHICDQANAIYIPWLRGKPHVMTCHDMLAIRSALGEIAEYQTGLTGRIYQRWILYDFKKVMQVTCVSNTTREDVLRITKLSSEKVSVVHNGLNYPYRPMPTKEFSQHLEQMGLADWMPFFFHVGGNFWYKNKAGLLRIFAHMVRLDNSDSWNLVLAGAALPETLARLAKELKIYDRIREVKNVTNEQLCALYSAAQGLIFPSTAEGFGWPIIEAQACGCPVFTSNRKPMTEVGGDGAVYFYPKEEARAAQAICDAFRNRDSLIGLGLQNAMRYSFETMISGYESIYHFVFR
jgi:glycosyltransferase involved in cell wall biosynthesis